LARLGVLSGLLMNRIFGPACMRKFTGGMKKIFPGFPLWTNQIRPPARIPRQASGADVPAQREVIFFPTCIARMMGGDIVQTFLSVSQKASVRVILPPDSGGLCCGQVFSSKGFREAYSRTANQVIERIWPLSQEGRIPVVTDTTSCTMTLKHS